MKKPNITDGEWFRDPEMDSVGFAVSAGEYDSVCDVYTNENDAKAISAVPEMIDALIEAKNWIDGKIIITHDFGGEERAKKAISSRIETALKKAGCTIK